MKMETAKVRMVVRTEKGQRGVIVEIKDGAKYSVVIQLDGAMAAIPYSVASLKKAALTEAEVVQRDIADGYIKYPVDLDRANRPWIERGWYSELAWVVGYAAQNNALLLHSGQPNRNHVVDDDFEFGKESHGEKFDVVMSNPNFVGLDDALDINFVQGRTGLRLVSLNKEGFWRFLESVGFQPGREHDQNFHVILRQIPDQWLSDFMAGARGAVPRLFSKS